MTNIVLFSKAPKNISFGITWAKIAKSNMQTVIRHDIELHPAAQESHWWPYLTVYGLAGNALNEDAVLNIFKAENRPFFDPLIVHTHSINEICRYTTGIPACVATAHGAIYAGALAVLLDRSE
jgi:tRNA A37 threonylcarbamoyladenosine synthetase subunit TsaC/SUA5/YrdC